MHAAVLLANFRLLGSPSQFFQPLQIPTSAETPSSRSRRQVHRQIWIVHYSRPVESAAKPCKMISILQQKASVKTIQVILFILKEFDEGQEPSRSCISGLSQGNSIANKSDLVFR